MFWKIASINKCKTASLVNKLAVLYSLTTFGIVAIVCFILYPTVEEIHHLNQGAYHDDLLSQCITKLAIVLLLSIICGIIFGKIIAKKGVKQVHLLSDKIKNINADSLGIQLNINDLPEELIPLGESFNTMLNRLEDSFSQLTQFSADIAHELRNPIHNLFGMNEAALTNNYTTEKHLEIFESNMEECRHLLRLIENLWFIARTDHGQMSIKREYLNARTETLNIIDYYEPYASEKNIAIHCDGDANIFVDAILFKRTICNILSNSLRHTPENGKIKIKITALLEHTTIALHDSGLGIEDIHLSKIFNRFYRVDSSRSSETGGLGLGLAIVKSIMDLHDGTIAIQSQLRVGTSVFLHFPSVLSEA